MTTHLQQDRGLIQGMRWNPTQRQTAIGENMPNEWLYNHVPATAGPAKRAPETTNHRMDTSQMQPPNSKPPNQDWKRGVNCAPRTPQTNHTPAVGRCVVIYKVCGNIRLKTRHAKNTPWMKPSNGNAWHEAAGAPNEPCTHFGGHLFPLRNLTRSQHRQSPRHNTDAFSHETPMRRMHPGEIPECAQPCKTSTLDYPQYDTTHLPKWRVCGNTWCLLPPCVKSPTRNMEAWPLTTVPEGPALKHPQLTRPRAKHPKITPEMGWATV
ncbi:hypothetical protein BS47DRAFT_1369580 [Hydnum rufescens UP504]|uniref:Uncharacterized protein n=1 Tax=Hydnum rufescens UP504 TaxID=1448309 RepID=A0A9P6ACF5_9AGAM|nr:hypothetical protein BS47DRAFT_1369580 [Hydnum rufescens UP504]